MWAGCVCCRGTAQAGSMAPIMVLRLKQWALSLREWRQFLSHDIWRVGRPGEKIPHGFLIKQVRVLILLVQQFVQDMLLVRAAALTFTTLLSLVPLLAVLVYVVKTLDLEAEVYKRIVGIIFSGVDIEAESGFDPVGQLTQFAQEGASPKALGYMGMAFVVATVFGLMMNIESAFNQIWGLRVRRSLYRKAADYVMVLLLLPIAVALVISMPTLLKSATWLEDQLLIKYLLGVSNYVLVWVAFTVLYTVVPNTKVRLPFALFGGLVASILWGLAAWAYVTFQFGLPNYKLIYAAAAQVPLLLMWLYVSWVIVLFGAELVFAYQNEKTYAMERLASSASHAYREALALKAMIEMARRFEDGAGPLEPMQAAEDWNVPTRLLNDTLEQLADAGLVQLLATDPPAYQPGRSVERIRLGDVVSAMREHGDAPSALREDPVLQYAYYNPRVPLAAAPLEMGAAEEGG